MQIAHTRGRIGTRDRVRRAPSNESARVREPRTHGLHGNRLKPERREKEIASHRANREVRVAGASAVTSAERAGSPIWPSAHAALWATKGGAASACASAATLPVSASNPSAYAAFDCDGGVGDRRGACAALVRARCHAPAQSRAPPPHAQGADPARRISWISAVSTLRASAIARRRPYRATLTGRMPTRAPVLDPAHAASANTNATIARPSSANAHRHSVRPRARAARQRGARTRDSMDRAR